jgi:predicted ATPase
VSHLEEALVTIDEALALVEDTGATAYEAEVYQTKGELLLVKSASNAKQAEQSLRTQSKLHAGRKPGDGKLRATTSLARLLARQGHRDEARAMLAKIYGWFTEGFDTADLKDAKELLEDLSNSPR